VSVAAFLCLFRLGADSLLGDEALYGAVESDSSASASWVPLTLHQEVYLNKPLGGFLLLHLFRALPVPPELALRLPAANAGIASCLVVFLFGHRWFGIWGGLVAGILLCASPSMLDRHALRGGTFDSVMLLLLSVALLALVEAMVAGDARWLRIATLAAVTTVLLKNMAGPGLAIGMACCLVGAAGRRSGLSGRRAAAAGITALAASLAVYLLWLVVLAAKLGSRFVLAHLRQDVLLRATGGLTRVPSRSVDFYAVQLADDFGWWLALIPLAALVLAMRHGWRSAGAAVSLPARAVVGWSLGGLLLLSIFPSKLPWYLLPVYPAVALSVGASAATLLRSLPGKLRVPSLAVVLLLLAAQVEPAVALVASKRKLHPLDELARHLERARDVAVSVEPGLRFRFSPRDVGQSDFDELQGVADYYYLRRLAVLHPGNWPPDEPSAGCQIAITSSIHPAQIAFEASAGWRSTRIRPPRDSALLLVHNRCLDGSRAPESLLPSSWAKSTVPRSASAR